MTSSRGGPTAILPPHGPAHPWPAGDFAPGGSLATYRLEHTPKERVARTLSAWSIGNSVSIALCTALAGLLADATSPRTALTVAGLLMLATPLLLPRRNHRAAR
ncbi:Transmembrane Efflux Protein [Streptomyces leeuwenhoekii]|uniref:Transmembrane Efflux Protein n=1 Tax=Streptomyces leeuwenhoekii TaxID=1437453 RepID=A0A0F7VXQ5_STRLW|nr:hypothetical protein ACH49_15190 [Streptomyces leeuwenhoekii]CQR65284.1 Transmembrane Efflux Protein [Streptomyces leeuwenhoekii]